MPTNSHAVCQCWTSIALRRSKILAAPLSLSQRQAVLTHLVQKCRIVALGAQKRQHKTRAGRLTVPKHNITSSNWPM